MNNLPLYSTRIIRNYVEYVTKYFPEVKEKDLLDDTGITPYQLDDDGHWLTQDQVDRFHRNLTEKIDVPNLPLQVGREFARSKAGGVISQYALGFITPGTAYAMLDKLHSRVSKATSQKVEPISKNKIRVIVTPKEGVDEKPFQCENRFGTFESIASLFTGKLAVVEHPTCVHRGDKSCTYIISWDQPRSFLWKRIRNYGSLIGAILTIASLFILPAHHVVIFILSVAVFITAVFLYTEKLEKKEINTILNNQSILARDLLDQISVSYDNSLLVQEIGQVTSKILDSREILKQITSIMAKRLKYERGLIYLSDAQDQYLTYAASYGFASELTEYLENMRFRLDNPSSKGEMIRAFNEQTPLMIRNADQTMYYRSDKTREFVHTIGTNSFICVPVAHEGKSLGILAVDSPISGKAPNQSDVNLIMGIANQIGVILKGVRAYQKLRESEERFRNLSENIPDIIATVDMEGRITYINPAVKKILGYSYAEVIGKYVIDFTKEEYRSEYSEMMHRVQSGKETIQSIEGILIHKDHRERLFDINLAPNLDSDNNITGLVANLKDITQQRMLETQLHHSSKMEAIGTLTGGISHDFNNILQALNGYTQLLLMNKDKTNTDSRYLANIEEMIKRATNLTRQLLLFSRKAEIRPQPLDLNEEIKKCFDILSQTVAKMITITLDLAPDLGIINADASQMGQIIMNLVLNSCDAMPEGGKILITSENETVHEDIFIDDVNINHGQYIKICVADTGSGMTREVKERIFEPFYTTKDGRGTGLGLAVVYGIVKNHSGAITCQSEYGRGTKFTIYLPRIDEPRQEGTIIRQSDVEDSILKGKETILIVDDEEMLLETGEAILTRYGYKTYIAKSGEEAIRIFAQEKGTIDLVFLDLIMPGMGGQKCLDALLKIDSSIPVVITSGYTAGVDARNILDKGASGFLNKPYQLQTLVETVRRTLDLPK
ncbi:MAG: PAS domain S-box protein [Syntrophales bacterium]|nr:PAS domain S-box protein [Syntrophales bacterium]